MMPDCHNSQKWPQLLAQSMMIFSMAMISTISLTVQEAMTGLQEVKVRTHTRLISTKELTPQQFADGFAQFVQHNRPPQPGLTAMYSMYAESRSAPYQLS